MATTWLSISTTRHFTSFTRWFTLRKLLQSCQSQMSLHPQHNHCRHCSIANGNGVQGETIQDQSSEKRIEVESSSNIHKRSFLRKLHKRVLSDNEKEADKQLLHSFEETSEEDIFGKLHERRNNLSHTSKQSQKSARKPHNPSVIENQPVKKQQFHRTEKIRLGQSVTSAVNCTESSKMEIGSKSRQLDRQWTNIFGTLDEEGSYQIRASPDEKYEEELEEEDVPFRRLSAVNRAHIPVWYGRKIEKFGKQGKIKEAIAVLDDWMLKRDRVMPTAYVFTALIGVLGRVGYTKKAFKLFNQMKKMGLQPEDPTYTALFNACSNSPWQADGLSRAAKLRQSMLLNDYTANLITYKAMIKAFGICGDLQMAFSLMDEMVTKFKPDHESFSFLLMACITDKEAGFEHALKVWIMMKECQILPDLPLFNLLLRSVRDCGIGDGDFLKQLSQSQTNFTENIQAEQSGDAIFINSNNSNQYRLMESHKKPISDRTFDRKDDIENSDELKLSEINGELSNSVLSGRQLDVTDSITSSTHSFLSVLDMSNVTTMTLSDMKRPEHRLAVIGGMNGFLSQMEKIGVKPDLRTFSQLLDVMPSNMEAENELISEMESRNITPDVDIFNLLIHRRCMRFHYLDARNVLEHLARHNLSPNIRSFGCLAMTCRKVADGMQLLKDMENMGLSPNLEIFTTLIRTSKMDFSYKLVLLKEMRKFGLEANQRLLRIIEKDIADARKIIVLKERKEAVSKFYNTAYFEKGYENFKAFYEWWLQEDSLLEENHPWQPFRQELK